MLPPLLGMAFDHGGAGLLRFARNDGWVGLTFLLAFTANAFADETKEQVNLQGYAAAHVECTEWNDGCATCKRDDAVHCSTPGIACQPHEIACVKP